MSPLTDAARGEARRGEARRGDATRRDTTSQTSLEFPIHWQSYPATAARNSDKSGFHLRRIIYSRKGEDRVGRPFRFASKRKKWSRWLAETRPTVGSKEQECRPQRRKVRSEGESLSVIPAEFLSD